MKHKMSTLSNLIRTMAVCLLVWGLLAIPSSAQTYEFHDLEMLAQLEGNDYRTLRNELLVSHPSLWDVEQALTHSWEAGLAAFVLNCWISDGRQFVEWDQFSLIPKRGPGYLRHPATIAGAVGQVFLIEQVWKTAPVPEVRDDAFDTLMRLNISGLTSLWRAVWENALSGELKAVALHALANDSSEATRDTLLNVLQDENSSKLLKLAALTGLGVARPWYATNVILQSFFNWEDHLDLVGYGFRALAAQPDKEAREALYQIALDPNSAEGVRVTAIVSFSDQPQQGDVAVLQTLLAAPAPQNIQKRATSALLNYR